MVDILITYFEAFGGNRENLSLEAVECFRRKKRLVKRDRSLGFACLPVAFGEVECRIRELDRDYRPRLWLMFGEKRKSGVISFERIALNIAHASIPDNLGQKPATATLHPAADLALLCPLRPEPFIQALGRAGIPSTISHHAGTFVCNAAYFHALFHRRKAVFFHLPGWLGKAVPGTESSSVRDGSLCARTGALSVLKAGDSREPLGDGHDCPDRDHLVDRLALAVQSIVEQARRLIV